MARWKAAQEVAAREVLLQQLAEQQKQRQAAEETAKRKVAETAAAREVLLQQLGEQQRLRQAAEESAKRKLAETIAARGSLLQQLAEQRRVAELEATRRHEQQVQQVADQAAERQATAVQAALAAEPFYHDPPRHIDIDAAIQERNRREQEWIQRMHQMWQNERRAEEQMQLDEQEELQRISIADRNLQERMRRLDQLANNMSSTRVDQYQAQVAAQREQIQMDREMAAALAAEYQMQRNNELALRRQMEEEESDDDESNDSDSDDQEYDEFGRLSPLVFPSSPMPSAHLLSSSPVQPRDPHGFHVPMRVAGMGTGQDQVTRGPMD